MVGTRSNGAQVSPEPQKASNPASEGPSRTRVQPPAAEEEGPPAPEPEAPPEREGASPRPNLARQLSRTNTQQACALRHIDPPRSSRLLSYPRAAHVHARSRARPVVGSLVVRARSLSADIAFKDKKVKERKEQFATRHGSEVAAKYAAQTAQIAKQIRLQDKNKRFILVPGKHRVRSCGS